MGYLLSIVYTAMLAYAVFKMPFFSLESIPRKAVVVLFLVKILAGFAYLLIYTYYYEDRATSDIYKYFDDGNVLFSAFSERPIDYLKMLTGFDGDSIHLEKYYNEMNFWYKERDYNLFNDNRTVIRCNSIVQLFSFGYIQIHTVFGSFLAFTGLFAIVKTIESKLNKYFIGLLFLVPSVMLFASGITKESLILLPLGLIFFHSTKLFSRFQIKSLIIIICCLYFLIYLKVYVLFSIVPGLIFYYWAMLSDRKLIVVKFIVVHTICLVLFVSAKHWSGYDFVRIISTKQHDFLNFIEGCKQVGSEIYIPYLKPTPQSLFLHTPNAILNTAFRPHLFECNSVVMFFSAIENTLIAALMFVALIFADFQRIKKNAIFLLFSLSFVIFLFAISGLITPVLGALVRYRVPALPFLIISLLMLINLKRLKKFIFNILPLKKISDE